jgi:hypothetical protein
MTIHRTVRAALAGIVATAAVGLVPATTSAGQLAQFTLKKDQVFTFKNNGAESGLSASLIDVTFKYLLPNTYGAANANIDARLTLVALVDAKATNTGGEITQTMSFALLGVRAVKQVNGNDDLMTAGLFAPNTVQGQITGTLNAKQSLYDAPTTHSPNALTISSSFFDFNGDYKKLGVELTLKPMNNALTINANGYLDSFTASGSGIIFGTPITAVVPEPASWVLASAGLVPAAVLSRRCDRRRRRSLCEVKRVSVGTFFNA